MKSRMERYYEVDNNTGTRTRKNADLYQKIYDNEEYSNIEGIATTLKPNEIDVSKIKEMLKSRDGNISEKNTRGTRSTPQLPKEEKMASLDYDDKNYDIRDILNKAKSERKDTGEKSYHKLQNNSYNVPKNLNVKKEYNSKEENGEELKELIHTITNTSLLNKMGDQELSLGILDELKSDTMVGDSSSIKAILEEEKEDLKDNNYLDDDDDDEKQNIDKSFFTSSLNFKDDDFDELQEMSENLKKNNTVMKVLAFILLVIITATVIFFLLK